ncbi:MAG TPA: S41 family peptidase [Myxococcaceae bacterium]
MKLGDFVESGTNEVRQLWTYAHVPGKKYIGKAVFVLTSKRTGSGAESFVSDLKRLKRASLIGETTAGATLPGGSQRVNEHFSIWISTGRSSTGKPEQENKGIAPDTATTAQEALNEAHRQALDQLIQSSSDPGWKAELVKVRATLNVH